MPQDASTPETNDAPAHDELIALTTEVVAAYVGNNAVATSDLSDLIGTVYAKLSALGAPEEPEVEQTPAVPVKRSVTKQAIVCLECGKKASMLKRHLGSAHGLTPEEYRAKWALPYDYPMVAPDYAETRRALAKRIGLGRKPAKAPAKSKASRQKKG